MNLGAFAGKTGSLPESVDLPWEYFAVRGCFLDTRGPLVIHMNSYWGLLVRVITRSHDTHAGPGVLGQTIDYGVVVEAKAWIGSNSLLAGCRIGEGAVVAAGSVVRGQVVAPGVMVAGNPARVIARWSGTSWNYLPVETSGFETRLS